MSAAFGANNFKLVRKLFCYSSNLSFWLACLSIVGLSFCGEFIYELWLEGKLSLDKIFFFVMLLGMAAQCFWYTCSVILTTTNKHSEMSIFYLLTASFSLGLSYVLSFRFGLLGFAMASLFHDFIMSVYVSRKSLLVIEYN